jgi:branched-chain amino acid transport system ATP-binding protein
MAGDVVFTAEGIRVDFGGLCACNVDEVRVRPGELSAIIGPNGAGKTTFLNAVMGMVRAHRSGRVLLSGASGTVDIMGWRPDKISRAGVSRTFQGLGLVQNLSAFDNLMLARYWRQRYSVIGAMLRSRRTLADERREAQGIDELLSEAGLESVRDVAARYLPYGVQKRIDLLRALALKPRVLLLDEPMAGLNREEKVVMSQDIRRVVTNDGIPVIMVEHDMSIVMSMASVIVVMVEGERIITGSPEVVRTDRRVITAYLGEPLDGAAGDEL